MWLERTGRVDFVVCDRCILFAEMKCIWFNEFEPESLARGRSWRLIRENRDDAEHARVDFLRTLEATRRQNDKKDELSRK